MERNTVKPFQTLYNRPHTKTTRQKWTSSQLKSTQTQTSRNKMVSNSSSSSNNATIATVAITTTVVVAAALITSSNDITVTNIHGKFLEHRFESFFVTFDFIIDNIILFSLHTFFFNFSVTQNVYVSGPGRACVA